MALPLPKVVADVGPGGGLVTAMGGMNALANNMQTTRYNKQKADYAGLTIPAQAYSQLAYANAVAPQILAKLMHNEGALANMSEEQKKNMIAAIQNAGFKTNNGLNLLSQNQAPGAPSSSSNNALSRWFGNLLNAARGQPAQQAQNTFAQPNMPQVAPQQLPQQSAPAVGDVVQGASVDPEFDEAYAAWQRTPEAQREFAKGEKANIPDRQEVINWYRNQKGQQPTYAENTGSYKGTVKEGEELGKHRAKSINDIGEQQMALSNTGANLDRIIDDINDPKFMDLRKDIPFYQDMQLKALSKVGNPEQQEMIGNFIADVKSFAGATVNSFKGQTMKREFDYADQLKPSENDTVNTARGKLRALKSLKEIAQRKNDVILDLMQKKHLNLGDAVNKANQMVDVKGIDKEVQKLTSPMITLKNPNTGETITLSISEARKRGVKNV